MECYFDYKLHFELSLMENDKVDYICPFNCVCVCIFLFFLFFTFSIYVCCWDLFLFCTWTVFTIAVIPLSVPYHYRIFGGRRYALLSEIDNTVVR
jgi:hypothetical protein